MRAGRRGLLRLADLLPQSLQHKGVDPGAQLGEEVVLLVVHVRGDLCMKLDGQAVEALVTRLTLLQILEELFPAGVVGQFLVRQCVTAFEVSRTAG